MSKLYRNFDLEDDKTFDELSEFYGDHINAMTTEDLHCKADIAWELCYRDNEIAKLKSQIETLRAYLNTIEDKFNKATLEIQLMRNAECIEDRFGVVIGSTNTWQDFDKLLLIMWGK